MRRVIPVVALLLLAPTAAFAENTEPPKPVKPLVKVKDEAAVKALESCGKPALAKTLTIKRGTPKVKGLTREQVVASRKVATAGKKLKAPARAQAIAIAAALTGDVSDVPAFYRGLLALPGWAGLPPTIAAHRVLGTPDPFEYDAMWPLALNVLREVSRARIADIATQVSSGKSAPSRCYASQADKSALPLPPGTTFTVDAPQVTETAPADPVAAAAASAPKTEFATSCGTPVNAVSGGTVDVTEGDSVGGPWLITVKSGAVTAYYSHIQRPTVKDGDLVLTGTQIAEVGDLGDLGECALGLSITTQAGADKPVLEVDPVTWLAQNLAAQDGPKMVPDTTFRFATLNVLGAHLTGPGNDRPSFASGASRMAGAMGLLESAEVSIVTLNEFEGPQASVLASSGEWDLHRATLNNVFRNGDGSGNAIAWRKDTWKLAVDPGEFEVPWQVTLHMPVVTLEHMRTGALVTVIGVHNPASTSKQGDQSGNRSRARDIELDAVAAYRKAAPTIPVLFAGDMNERNEAFCGFTRSGLLQASGGGSVGPSCSPPRHGPVDWIFGTTDVDFDLQVINNGTLGRISDHPLISVEVTIPERAMVKLQAARDPKADQ